MEEYRTLIDRLYTHFLLRDLFGKVIPGLIILSALLISMTSINFVFENALKMSFGLWIVIIGLSWIIAFSMQGLGIKIRLFKYFIDDNDRNWHNKERKFFQYALDHDKQQYERFTVIKEASGTASVSIFFSLAMHVLFISVKCKMTLCIYDLIYLLLLIIVFIIAYFLNRMHVYHCRKQCNYLDDFLDERNIKV